jgi:phosphoserine phosphatase
MLSIRRSHKNRFSPLLPGASDLHEILKSHGINNLIVTGTAMNMCCETAIAFSWNRIRIAPGTSNRCDTCPRAKGRFVASSAPKRL